ncbi:2-hydroxyacid dehydrogenase [Sphingosinicella soli]|uniref:Glyoxylate reductase n=1 Tax=Sphingosinicella soli TaxID=333708 RepID=A0A7W7B018_9SPHN|nr:D-glycerate dehydrogenase [Sphingosinicella soli]MBB4631528.1 glyoxylate reductase [Sphingosinicella soli]
MEDRPRRPRVVVTRRLPQPVEARMSELFDSVLNPEDKAMSQDALAAAMADCDVFLPTVTDTIDAALIAAAPPRLKLIANYGTGVNHIDLVAARAKGIMVTNTPGVLTEDTADLAMSLILSVPRRLTEGSRQLYSGHWDGWKPCDVHGHRITGKKLGIIGMGRIGQAIAARARAFGLRIHYHNRRPLADTVEGMLGATYWDDLDAMIEAVDIVSINCPLTDETRHLFDARRIALLGCDGYLVNTARGEIIDEEALADALEKGVIAGAGLDVFEDEPRINPRLLPLGNVTLLPHMGSATFEGRQAMGDKVVTNIRAWADGHRPPDQVLEGWL